MSFGVADGVGGWVDSGVDPSLFSQALMYHAHRFAKRSWAGEPEIDPLAKAQDGDIYDSETSSGRELLPRDCLGLAYDAVLRESEVVAGE